MAKKSKILKWLEPNKLLLIESWTSDGLTMKQIAYNMGIGESTLYKYINDYPELANAIDNGRDVKVAILENSMFKSANGFKKEDIIVDNDGKARKNITEIPPNVMAGIFLLKHLRPDKYGDKHEVNTETKEMLNKVLNKIEGNI